MFKLGLVVICTLNNFNSLPSKIEGRVVLSLKNTISISIENKTKTQSIEIVLNKKQCRAKR